MSISLVILLLSLIVLLLSVVIHELAHGYVAYSLGDPTAKYAGRLTLNPLKHLDMFGSIILPLLLLVATAGQGPIFGWAKPVPINPYNFKDQKWGSFKVAIAGPITNFSIAIIFAVVNRLLPLTSIAKSQILYSFLTNNQNALSSILVHSPLSLLFLFFFIVSFYNFLWGLFNLVPISPLDGSWVLFNFFPPHWERTKIWLQQYGLFILLFFIFFGGLQFLGARGTIAIRAL
jgi:Zn-dependent protease